MTPRASSPLPSASGSSSSRSRRSGAGRGLRRRRADRASSARGTRLAPDRLPRPDLADVGARPVGVFRPCDCRALAAGRLLGAEPRRLLRPDEDAPPGRSASLATVYVGRGLRAVLILAAALFLARFWQIDIVQLAGQDTLLTRLVRGALSAVVIFLVADLLWQIMKTLIDRRLAAAHGASGLEDEAAAREARLRTLLPIFRILAFVVLAVVAVMMALSALGVEIGPLIASAGVVGVAIGFGSQTLVRDIISGIFYLSRRCLPGRRVHPERQLQGHGRVLQPALGEAPPPSRAGLHRALRPARRGAEHEPRLGHRQDDDRRQLRFGHREGEEAHQGDRQGACRRSGVRAARHRAA